MKYFKFIGNLDISSALQEIKENDIFFSPHTPRSEQSMPLREGLSIHLRIHNFQSIENKATYFYMNAKDQADSMLSAIDTNQYILFPECKKLINSALKLIDKSGILGRCYIAKMIPNAKIYPHYDPGKYFELHDRYHIVLQTNEGVSFSCGEKDNCETIRFNVGELWVFNNKILHWASNNGNSDRIHIIMDVKHDELHFN